MYIDKQYEAHKEHLHDIYCDVQRYRLAQEVKSTPRKLFSGQFLAKLWQRRPRFNLHVVRAYPEVPMAALPKTSE